MRRTSEGGVSYQAIKGDTRHMLTKNLVFFSVIVCPCLHFGLPPRCPQAMWCHLGKIEPFSATPAQVGLVGYDQWGKHFLKYSAIAGN